MANYERIVELVESFLDDFAVMSTQDYQNILLTVEQEEKEKTT